MIRPKGLAILFLMLTPPLAPPLMAASAATGHSFEAWNISTGMRLTPATIQTGKERPAVVEAFRNEIVSLQFAVRATQTLKPFRAACQAVNPASGRALPCSWVRIRYPGYIPVDERAEDMADPLFASPPAEIKPNWTQGVWLTIWVPKGAPARDYTAALQIRAGRERARFKITLRVLRFTLPAITRGSFDLNIWQDPASVARIAKVPLWSPAHWKLLEAYARDLAAHGQKSITASILYNPWRSQTGFVYPSMVQWRFPGRYQLGQASKFQFDFSVFDRYVKMMMKAGIDRSIQCFSMVDGPGSTSLCNIGYRDTFTGKLRVCPTHVGGPMYREVWKAFLPVFVRHLKKRGWLSRTSIGFDEKPQSVMEDIFSVLKANAPQLKVALAGGTSSQESSTVGDLTLNWRALEHPRRLRRLLCERRNVGPTTFYTACSPAMPNTFIYSPQWESRLMPWIAFHYGLAGYLRWAYQSWPQDVWHQPNIRWHSGDSFLVYPGKHGPISSTRWEMLRQGIEDYEALEMLKQTIAALQKSPHQAGEAAQLAKRMSAAVADAINYNRCYGVPEPGRARRTIDTLLTEAERR